MAPAMVNADSTSRMVKTKRWALHYNEAGGGHPLIMLHGTGPGATGWSNFSPNIGPLSEKYRVILLDFPGWGKSDPNDSASEPRNELNATAVKLLMDELGIEKAALVGNSMGGAATQQFALQYPERLSHYVTMGAGGGGASLSVPGGRLSEGIKIIEQTYADPSPENFRRLVDIMVFDKRFVTDELCQMRSEAALANAGHLRNWLAIRAAQPSYSPSVTYGNLVGLAALKVPALLVHGRDDHVIPCANSLRLAAVIPNSRLLVFGRCGHWAQLEHSAEFNAALDGFLSANL